MASKRIQSPPYPSMAFATVLAKLKAAKALRTGASNEGEVLRSLGYSGMSGSAKDTVNTLRQHGMLEKGPDGFRITQLGVDSLEEDSGARATAAWTPPVFRLLLDTVGPEPNENETARVLAANGYGGTATRTLWRNYLAVLRTFEPPAANRRVEEMTAIPDIAIPEPGRAARTVFDYEFEGGAGVAIMVRGALDAADLMTVITDWMAMKRRELKA